MTTKLKELIYWTMLLPDCNWNTLYTSVKTNNTKLKSVRHLIKNSHVSDKYGTVQLHKINITNVNIDIINT